MSESQPPFEQFFAYRRFQPVAELTPDGERVLFVSNISGQFNLWSARVDGGWPDQLTTFTENTVRAVAVRDDGDDPLHRRPRRRRVPPALPHSRRRRLARAAHRPAAGAALRSAPARGRPTGHRSRSPRTRGSPKTARSSSGATATTSRATSSARACTRSRQASRPTARSSSALEFRSNSDMSLFLVDVESGDATELTPHEVDVEVPARPVGAPTARASTSSPTRDASSWGSRSRRSHRRARVGRGARPRHRRARRLGRRARPRLARERRRLRPRCASATSRRGDDLPAPKLPQRHRLGLRLGPVALARRLARSRSRGTSPRARRRSTSSRPPRGDARPVTESRAAGLVRARAARARARPLPELRRPRDPRVAVPARRRRARAVRRRDPRRPGGAGEARLPAALPVPPDRGIGVLATNIRGSTGYGKTYQKLIHHDWGGGDLEDWRHAAEWLKAQDFVDGDRLGVYGGSYGGFATLIVRHAPAGVLARSGRHRRPVEPADVRPRGAAAMGALHGEVGRRSRHRGRLPARALADHVRRPGARGAARDPGSEGPARRARPSPTRWSSGCASSAARSSTRSSRTRATASRATRTRSAATG